MVLLFKYLRANSIDEFVSMAFLYSKLGSAAALYFVDPSLAGYYAMLCIPFFFFLRQPMYRGPSKIIRVLSKEMLYKQILGVNDERDLVLGVKAYELDKQQKKSNKKKTLDFGKKKDQDFSTANQTLLVFNAPWCSACVFTYSIWVRFANRFTTSKLRVVEVDTRLEEICRHFKVNAKDGR